MTLELVSFGHEGFDVTNSRDADRAGKESREHADCLESGVSTGTNASDANAGRVHLAFGDQVAGTICSVVHVEHTPTSIKKLAVGTSVTRGPGVVEQGNGISSCGVVLPHHAKAGVGVDGGPAVNGDDERRKLAWGTTVLRIRGREKKCMGESIRVGGDGARE